MCLTTPRRTIGLYIVIEILLNQTNGKMVKQLGASENTKYPRSVFHYFVLRRI